MRVIVPYKFVQAASFAPARDANLLRREVFPSVQLLSDPISSDPGAIVCFVKLLGAFPCELRTQKRIKVFKFSTEPPLRYASSWVKVTDSSEDKTYSVGFHT